MAKIQLSEVGEFILIPEGEHKMTITKVKYDEDFGKIVVNMKSDENYYHIERFTLIDANENPIKGAINAFSYLSKTALKDFTRKDIDPDELIGKRVCVTIVHNKVGERTFANSNGYKELNEEPNENINEDINEILEL